MIYPFMTLEDDTEITYSECVRMVRLKFILRLQMKVIASIVWNVYYQSIVYKMLKVIQMKKSKIM